MLYVVGPGHGAPAILACLWLEGSMEKFYPQFSRDADGLARLISTFSTTGGPPRYILLSISYCCYFLLILPKSYQCGNSGCHSRGRGAWVRAGRFVRRRHGQSRPYRHMCDWRRRGRVRANSNVGFQLTIYITRTDFFVQELACSEIPRP
jgi:hypothetical protein